MSEPAAQPDPVPAFVAFIDAHARTLAEIGTPDALEAGAALIAASRAMGDALRLAGEAFTAAAERAATVH